MVSADSLILLASVIAASIFLAQWDSVWRRAGPPNARLRIALKLGRRGGPHIVQCLRPGGPNTAFVTSPPDERAWRSSSTCGAKLGVGRVSRSVTDDVLWIPLAALGVRRRGGSESVAHRCTRFCRAPPSATPDSITGQHVRF